MDFERRVDPRTDPTYSLHNLLRTRAERLGIASAVGTDQGVLMAASHRDRRLEEALARGSLGQGPVRRVDVGGRVALVAALGGADGLVDDLVERVGAILREGAR